EPTRLLSLIREKIQDRKPSPKPSKESVASILEGDGITTIQRWLWRVERTDELVSVSLTAKERTAHLPEIIESIVGRLRRIRILEAIALSSPAAVAHGQLRYRQGY